MDFQSSKDMVIIALASLVSGYVGLQMRTIAESVQDLNVKIAQILAHIESHGEKLSDLAVRVTKLEDK